MEFAFVRNLEKYIHGLYKIKYKKLLLSYQNKYYTFMTIRLFNVASFSRIKNGNECSF